MTQLWHPLNINQWRENLKDDVTKPAKEILGFPVLYETTLRARSFTGLCVFMVIIMHFAAISIC